MAIAIDNTWDVSPNLKIYNGAGLSSKKLTGRFNPNASNFTYTEADNFLWSFSQIFNMGGMQTEAWFTAKSDNINLYY